ncbi:hypothetical protein BS47DRAFT_1364933 [Hydnum rufescens UP504]|uniref:Uncharacterized protein n=1 Tax=Hydnum rufescens UP504 TaxID=1448309 RepID=A0A9P6AQC5_9AGAM|nr:hypothetical protein BS47DRAFT_1364933 [Hydnum rufescens UP504]
MSPFPLRNQTSLGRSTSLEFVPDSVWASGDVHLNVLTRFAYNCRGYAEYVMHLAIDHIARTYNLDLPVFGIDDRRVGAVYHLPLTPADRQAVDDLVRMGTPVFGVVEYLHRDHRDTVPDCCPDSPEAAAAAVAEYFAAMKKWDKQNVDVAEPHLGYPGELDRNDRPLCEAASCVLPAGEICETDVVALWDFLGCGLWPAAQAYKVPKFYYKYEFGEAIKIYVNEDDSPMASSSKVVGDNMEDHGFNIYDDIMGNPYDKDNDNWENEGDYDLNPTPHLDAKQEAEAKALVLAAESGDGTAKSQITKVLQGAQGKKRGKWHNGKPPQTDFETAVMQLWRSSDGPSKAKKKAGKKTCPGETACEADTAAAPQIRALEEAQRLEAERLKREAEEHVRLQQGGHASVAPAPSSVPAPPVPAPPVPALPVPSAPASVPNPAQATHSDPNPPPLLLIGPGLPLVKVRPSTLATPKEGQDHPWSHQGGHEWCNENCQGDDLGSWEGNGSHQAPEHPKSLSTGAMAASGMIVMGRCRMDLGRGTWCIRVMEGVFRRVGQSVGQEVWLVVLIAVASTSTWGDGWEFGDDWWGGIGGTTTSGDTSWPLPLQEHHAVWTQVQHEMEFDATAISDLQPPLTTRRNERSSADYDSDASSDDTEGGELEESFEPQEASLIVAMDQASVEEA